MCRRTNMRRSPSESAEISLHAVASADKISHMKHIKTFYNVRAVLLCDHCVWVIEVRLQLASLKCR